VFAPGSHITMEIARRWCHEYKGLAGVVAKRQGRTCHGQGFAMQVKRTGGGGGRGAVKVKKTNIRGPSKHYKKSYYKGERKAMCCSPPTPQQKSKGGLTGKLRKQQRNPHSTTILTF